MDYLAAWNCMRREKVTVESKSPSFWLRRVGPTENGLIAASLSHLLRAFGITEYLTGASQCCAWQSSLVCVRAHQTIYLSTLLNVMCDEDTHTHTYTHTHLPARGGMTTAQLPLAGCVESDPKPAGVATPRQAWHLHLPGLPLSPSLTDLTDRQTGGNLCLTEEILNNWSAGQQPLGRSLVGSCVLSALPLDVCYAVIVIYSKRVAVDQIIYIYIYLYLFMMLYIWFISDIVQQWYLQTSTFPLSGIIQCSVTLYTFPKWKGSNVQYHNPRSPKP